MPIYLEVLLVICITCQPSAGSKTRQEVLAQLLQNYDPNVYPNDREGNQTEVTVQLTITDIDQVNDVAQELEMRLFLRSTWRDPRLQFENETNLTFTSIELTGDKVNKVWMPDLFFLDEKKASSHGIMGTEKLIYIYQDGDISFSERVTMTTECDMNLRMFPFDTQECTLHIESYAYTTKSLVLKWAPVEPVGNLEINMPYFRLNKYIKTTSGLARWNTFSIYEDERVFSYLNATLTLERLSEVNGFFYFGTYPFYMIIALISFGMKDTAPRISSACAAIGGVAIQWIAYSSRLPAVPHFTVIDEWILGHTIIIWLAITYHAICHILTSMSKDKNERFKDELEDEKENTPDDTEDKKGKTPDITQDEKENTPDDTEDKKGKTPDITQKKTQDNTASTISNSSSSTVIEWSVTLSKVKEEGKKKRRIIYEPDERIIIKSFNEVKFLAKKLNEMCPFRKFPRHEENEIENPEAYIDELIVTLKPATRKKYTKNQEKEIKKFLGSKNYCGRNCWFWVTGKKNELHERSVTLKINKNSGQVKRIENKPDETPFYFTRSFKDFYYLQTYLQAKYPDFKWPRLPLHNVLTIKEQIKLKGKREKYVGEMVELLQPGFWKHHSEIKKTMENFTEREEWKGSKWYSCHRIQIVAWVDTLGQKTTPDLPAFIVFCLVYLNFVAGILCNKFNYSGLFFLFEVVLIILAVSLIGIKYVYMRPPNLWQHNKETEPTEATPLV